MFTFLHISPPLSLCTQHVWKCIVRCTYIHSWCEIEYAQIILRGIQIPSTECCCSCSYFCFEIDLSRWLMHLSLLHFFKNKIGKSWLVRAELVFADYSWLLKPVSSGYLYKVFLIYSFRDVLLEAKSLMGTYVLFLYCRPSSWCGRRECE